METQSESLPDLEDKFDQVSSKVDKLSNRRDILREKKSEVSERIDSLRDEALILREVEELFKFLLDESIHEYADHFSNIVTEGLQSIFFDQDLKFDVRVTESHGKVNLEFITKQGDHQGQSLESFGGGVASVQSLILRLLVIQKTDLAPYLILDESLASLSEEYIQPMASFLKKLRSQTGIDILLITHNREFAEHANTSYLASEEEKEGETFLTLEELS